MRIMLLPWLLLLLLLLPLFPVSLHLRLCLIERREEGPFLRLGVGGPLGDERAARQIHQAVESAQHGIPGVRGSRLLVRWMRLLRWLLLLLLLLL